MHAVHVHNLSRTAVFNTINNVHAKWRNVHTRTRGVNHLLLRVYLWFNRISQYVHKFSPFAVCLSGCLGKGHNAETTTQRKRGIAIEQSFEPPSISSFRLHPVLRFENRSEGLANRIWQKEQHQRIIQTAIKVRTIRLHHINCCPFGLTASSNRRPNQPITPTPSKREYFH